MKRTSECRIYNEHDGIKLWLLRGIRTKLKSNPAFILSINKMKSPPTKLFFVLFFCFSCQTNNGQTNSLQKSNTISTALGNGSNAGNKNELQKLKFDPIRITDFLTKYPRLFTIKNELDSFYYNRQYTLAWFDANGLIEPAGNLYNHIRNMNTEGINNKLPYQIEFASMMDNEIIDSLNIDVEIMLTAQYFVYTKYVWTGLSETETKDINWYLPRKKISSSSLLDSLIGGKDILSSPPVYRQYGLLQNQLKKYRDIGLAGGFPVIGQVKKSLKKGDSSEIIVAIKRWLSITGNFPAGNSNKVFDNNLEAAIKQFQQRFGLKADGIIGASVITEMNIPLRERIQQIMVNMERSRWVPVSLSSDYLVLNIPEFRLHAYENDSLIWSMDAVVGKPVHKTVIFSGEIKYIVFSPYWNVPTSILKNEVLPGIRRNKNYLSSHNMEWNNGQVRQKPGADNALGLVKFLFPNSYNIYLHDSPAKSLFSETTRAFSHGCIRLSDAEKLANYLLENDDEWTTGKINTAMHLGKEQYVTLKKSETVFIVYFTSWVDREGQLNFRKDLYERDKRLAEMLLLNAIH